MENKVDLDYVLAEIENNNGSRIKSISEVNKERFLKYLNKKNLNTAKMTKTEIRNEFRIWIAIKNNK